ncbi:MAG: hypothetical protein JXA33_13670 [Anaerolineae bacterium]|nr:hypothetical protein [Anaerolineae bacterium]
MNIYSRIVVIVILFVLKLILGIWLTLTGKPYNGILVTIHKLISLATVIFIGVAVYRLREGVGLNTVELGAVIVTGVLFFAAIISGGLASTETLAYPAIILIHRIVPFLSILATIVTLYLLMSPQR